MKPHIRLLVYLAVFAFPLSLVIAEEAREVTWKDLLPSGLAEFDDPFADLSEQQLRDLGMIARFRSLLARDAIDSDGVSAGKAAKLITEFEAQGINVDWILSQRERVIMERRKRGEHVDTGMAGKMVRIPGYVLPLREGEGKVFEFLLVPWVGACIHTPPPPPNQMIHVTVPGGMVTRGRFSAIWLEGAVELKPASYNLFLVDGSRQVKVAYTMVSQNISAYSAGSSDALAKVKMPDATFEGHNWFQTWQAKVSFIFTRAMSGLRDDGSSKAFWFAILVAFSYGLVHTLGPGHGKAVVVSYFIGDGGSFRKGISMGVMIAVFHVLSSILVVLIADFAVRQATGQAPSDYRFIRLGSYALMIIIGAVMLSRAIKGSGHSGKSAESETGGHSHASHAHHDCLACAALEKKKKGAGTWLALAVGAVPCTGALLVLLFGVANDLLFPAILMVAAISAGMALAMSGIGVLAIIGRRMAFKMMKGDDHKRVRFTSGLRIAGAALILTIGLLLFGLTYSNSGQLFSTDQQTQPSNASS